MPKTGLSAKGTARLIDSALRGPVTGQRSNRTEGRSAIRVIEGLSRDPEKMHHNPVAIRLAARGASSDS